MSRRRTLRPEEEEIWRAVAGTVNPRHPVGPVFLKPMESAHPKPAQPDTTAPPAPAKPLLSAFRLGEAARSRQISPSSPQAASLQMDAKTHGKMTRGKITPEARLDLHGMTLSEAHPELIRFVLNAQSAGMRLVLVITGKGKQGRDTGPIPQRMGALRHHVPQWLRLLPLQPAVLQIAESHLKHGGSGAYYVYLRRR